MFSLFNFHPFFQLTPFAPMCGVRTPMTTLALAGCGLFNSLENSQLLLPVFKHVRQWAYKLANKNLI